MNMKRLWKFHDLVECHAVGRYPSMTLDLLACPQCSTLAVKRISALVTTIIVFRKFVLGQVIMASWLSLLGEAVMSLAITCAV